MPRTISDEEINAFVNAVERFGPDFDELLELIRMKRPDSDHDWETRQMMMIEALGRMVRSVADISVNTVGIDMPIFRNFLDQVKTSS